MGNPSSKSHKESTERSILTSMRDDEQRGNVNASRKSKIKKTPLSKIMTEPGHQP